MGAMKIESWNKIYMKIADKYGLQLEDVGNIVEFEDWHEDTRYCDGGYDFHVNFTFQSHQACKRPFPKGTVFNEHGYVEDTAYYYHVGDEAVV
jgi:hypothetical protein